MKLKKLASALAMIGAVTFGTSAYADPTITNVDGVLTPFGGFDWASAAAAWTSGYTGVVGSTFTLYYAGWAANVLDTSGLALYAPKLDASANGSPVTPGAYEYTIFGALTETVTSCNADASTCQFRVTGGTFDIFYDTTANAKISDGTGFLNGTKIISGTVDNSLVPNAFNNATGGQATLSGLVTYTNASFVAPALVGTSLTSTLQLGNAQTGFTAPTGFDFDNNGTSDTLGTPGVIKFQADANQLFTTKVPEPGSLALVGAALLAGGALTRRRKNNV
ncbi:hypothetical protein BH11PSE9_BH11PSE9_01250 [soil metagenome]